MNDSIAAIIEREYDENPAYRKAVDAYTSRRQSTAGITASPDSSVSPFTGKSVQPAPEPVLVTPAGAGLGGGR